MTFGSIVASLVFSSIGFVAFTYGKKEGRYRTMALGGVLMAYSYFTPGLLLTCLVGCALTAALYFVWGR